MSLPIRPLDTGLMSAHRNFAVTAALADMHRAGQTPHTFCRYPSSVLLGCCQRLADAIRMKDCRSYRIEVARRVTVDGVSARICSGIAALLARFGVPAWFRPINDVEIGGSKIPGSSDWIEGSTMVFQGTVLIDVDPVEMPAILRLLAAPTGHQAHTNFAARVTSISEWLGRVRSKDELIGLLIVGVSDRWHQEFRPYALTCAKLRPKDCHLDEGIWTDEFADIPMIMATVPEARADRVAAMGAHVP